MYKIAISGKAGAGKDTLAKRIPVEFKKITGSNCKYKIEALANPIKEIIKIMFPYTKDEILYGPSENRKTLVDNAFLNNEQLSYRRLLQHLGTEVCRGYNTDIWLNVLSYRENLAEVNNNDIFIVSDCRFYNEFLYLKNNNYIMIRIKRDNDMQMTHASEVEQEQILDSQFDFVINNNKSKKDLYKTISEVLRKML